MVKWMRISYPKLMCPCWYKRRMKFLVCFGLSSSVKRQMSTMAIIFFFICSMSINIMYWNCRGAGNLYFCEILCDLSKVNKVDLIFVVEPKVSRDKAEEIIRRTNMQCIQRVEAISRLRGL